MNTQIKTLVCVNCQMNLWSQSYYDKNVKTIREPPPDELQSAHNATWMPTLTVGAKEMFMSFTKKATLWFITPHCALLVKYCSHLIVLVKLQTCNLIYCRQHLRRNLYQMFSACSSFRYVLSVTGSDWPSFTDCGNSCRDWNLFSLTRCDILF